VIRAFGLAAAAHVLAGVAGAASAGGVADPGVSATEIVIGGTVPLSGEAAAFGSVGPGAKAYFYHVSASGGVYGRRIRYFFYYVAYNPAQTVQLTRRLV
jgi:ABC-type branched-subunit amino acid transport system substrate-binding protein